MIVECTNISWKTIYDDTKIFWQRTPGSLSPGRKRHVLSPYETKFQREKWNRLVCSESERSGEADSCVVERKLYERQSFSHGKESVITGEDT